ncbi:hypothetical protein M0P65_06195 [Candidatus Gracilibacteria bacterium]|nr:hypothetical protein [Candidatus Gracilibacteria bacterium]
MKIYIFGKSGSGKTTIGKELSNVLKIDFFELDKMFWDFKKDISISNKVERANIINNLLKNNNWIIEGLYRQDWLDKVISDSDYIFYINRNDLIIDIQIIKRFIKRIVGLEKSERKSSFKLIYEFLKDNHSGRFEKNHLKEFNSRLIKLNKNLIEVKSISELKRSVL